MIARLHILHLERHKVLWIGTEAGPHSAKCKHIILRKIVIFGRVPVATDRDPQRLGIPENYRGLARIS
jgi:hypothetical protein